MSKLITSGCHKGGVARTGSVGANGGRVIVEAIGGRRYAVTSDVEDRVVVEVGTERGC